MAATATEGLTTFDPNLIGTGGLIVPMVVGPTIGDLVGAVTPNAALVPIIPGPRQGFG